MRFANRQAAAIVAILLVALAQGSCSFFDCLRLSVGDEDDVREALFLYLFQRNESAWQASAAAYCLTIEDKDPSPEFLTRFRNHTPAVRKRSDCVIAPDTGVREKGTGKESLVFWLGKIKKLDNCGVEIPAGYYEGNMSASGASYVLSYAKGQWKVTATYSKWIS